MTAASISREFALNLDMIDRIAATGNGSKSL
ncbi:hypothetical protein X739_31915 [Mesorhizobium sp. LNHC220B00]|nr:hypothetical protein X739_31915 [Mesorhizobium sp. LNHC220B00]